MFKSWLCRSFVSRELQYEYAVMLRSDYYEISAHSVEFLYASIFSGKYNDFCLFMLLFCMFIFVNSLFFCTCVDVIVLSLFASIIAKCHFMNVRAECPKSFLLQLFAASNGVECGLFPCVIVPIRIRKSRKCGLFGGLRRCRRPHIAV